MRAFPGQTSLFTALSLAVFASGCGGGPGGLDESVSSTLGTRMGVDYSFGRPSPASIRAAGYTFAARYVSDVSSKNISAGEHQALEAAGVDVVANWEDDGHEEILSGYARGAQDAQRAQALAVGAGMPATRPIYFSIDFDASAANQPAIDSFYDGVASVLGRNRTGAYGGYSQVKRLFDDGKITWAWQTYAWSGGNWDARAQVRQIDNGAACSGSCDIDEAAADDFGEWNFQTAAPVRAVALNGTNSGYTLDGFGNLKPFGSAPPVTGIGTWNWDIARALALRPDGVSGYVLDGWGGIHPFGGAPAVGGGPYWSGWDIARQIVLRADGVSGYVLDGYGAVHPFGGAPDVGATAYWSGWDIARDVVLRSDGKSGYTLDGYGGIHPFGGAPNVAWTGYWAGWDIAHRMVLSFDDVSGYVLDGYGGVHPFGNALPVEMSFYQANDVVRDLALDRTALGGVTVDASGAVHPFTASREHRSLGVGAEDHGVQMDAFGALGGLNGATAPAVSTWTWDIARDVALRADGVSGYLLDGWGGVHPFGGATVADDSAYWSGWDIARRLALRADAVSGYVLDGYGGIHPFGNAPAVGGNAYWPSWDIARDIVLRPDGTSGYVLEGWGGLHAFGGAPDIAQSAYWKGWDIARAASITPDGKAGYVLDGYGGVHPFGSAGAATVSAYYPGWDVATDVVLNTEGTGGYVLDVYGGVHPFTGNVKAQTEGNAPPVDTGTPADGGTWAAKPPGEKRGDAGTPEAPGSESASKLGINGGCSSSAGGMAGWALLAGVGMLLRRRSP